MIGCDKIVSIDDHLQAYYFEKHKKCKLRKNYLSKLRNAAELLCHGFSADLLTELIVEKSNNLLISLQNKDEILGFIVMHEKSQFVIYLDLICSKTSFGGILLRLGEKWILEKFPSFKVLELQSVNDARYFYIGKGFQFKYPFLKYQVKEFNRLKQHNKNLIYRERVSYILESHDFIRDSFSILCMVTTNINDASSSFAFGKDLNIKNLNRNLKQELIENQHPEIIQVQTDWIIFNLYDTNHPLFKQLSQDITANFGISIPSVEYPEFLFISRSSSLTFILQKLNSTMGLIKLMDNVIDTIQLDYIVKIASANVKNFIPHCIELLINANNEKQALFLLSISFDFKIEQMKFIKNITELREYNQMNEEHNISDYMTMYINKEDIIKELQESRQEAKQESKQFGIDVDAISALYTLDKMRPDFDVMISTELVTFLKRRYIDMPKNHALLIFREHFGNELLQDAENIINELIYSAQPHVSIENSHELIDLICSCQDLKELMKMDKINWGALSNDTLFISKQLQLNALLYEMKIILNNRVQIPIHLTNDLSHLTSLVTQTYYYDKVANTNHLPIVLSHCENMLDKTIKKSNIIPMCYLCTHILFTFTEFGYLPKFRPIEVLPNVMEIAFQFLQSHFMYVYEKSLEENVQALDILAEMVDVFLLLHEMVPTNVIQLLDEVQGKHFMSEKIEINWNKMHMILVNVDARMNYRNTIQHKKDVIDLTLD